MEQPTIFALSDRERDISNEIIDLFNENELSIREIIRILVFTMSETIVQADKVVLDKYGVICQNKCVII